MLMCVVRSCGHLQEFEQPAVPFSAEQIETFSSRKCRECRSAEEKAAAEARQAERNRNSELMASAVRDAAEKKLLAAALHEKKHHLFLQREQAALKILCALCANPANNGIADAELLRRADALSAELVAHFKRLRVQHYESRKQE